MSTRANGDGIHRISLVVSPEPGEDELLAILEALGSLKCAEREGVTVPGQVSRWERSARTSVTRKSEWPVQVQGWRQRRS